MAYKRHVWTEDEVITAEKLNNIEEGVASLYGELEINELQESEEVK